MIEYVTSKPNDDKTLYLWATRTAAEGRSFTMMPKDMATRAFGLVKIYEFTERDRPGAK